MGLQTKAHSRNIPTYQSADILPVYKAAAGTLGSTGGMAADYIQELIVDTAAEEPVECIPDSDFLVRQPHLWRYRMTDRTLKNLEFLCCILDIAKYLPLIKIFFINFRFRRFIICRFLSFYHDFCSDSRAFAEMFICPELFFKILLYLTNVGFTPG